MKKVVLLTFTHANTRKPVKVVQDLIFGFWYAEGNACTFLLGPGGALIPVSESVDAVSALLEKQPQGGGTHE